MGLYLSQGYLSKSERNSSTGVWTHLLRCCSLFAIKPRRIPLKNSFTETSSFYGNFISNKEWINRFGLVWFGWFGFMVYQSL